MACAILAIAIAIAIILITWGVSTLIRFALSRSREFLADAGAAELTKNPDAMVRALRKIEGHATFDVPSRMEAFFIENPVSNRLTGLLATHPSMDERVEALAALRRRAGCGPYEPSPAAGRVTGCTALAQTNSDGDAPHDGQPVCRKSNGSSLRRWTNEIRTLNGPFRRRWAITALQTRRRLIDCRPIIKNAMKKTNTHMGGIRMRKMSKSCLVALGIGLALGFI